jgi:hypothetical protein
MATTTNYSWETPDDTDLVKDGAAAIRTLGSSIDTTTKALNPSTTLGDIEYRSSTANTNTRLAIGSTNQVLTVTGGVPTWVTPAGGGGMTLLSTTALSGASTTISVDPTGYKMLQIIIRNFFNASDVQRMRFNGNTSTDYSFVVQYWSGSAGTSGLPSGQSGRFQTSFNLYTAAQNSTNDATAQITIYDPDDTGNNKLYTVSSGGRGDDTFFQGAFGNGTFNASGAITSITLFGTSTQGGDVLIYGVK